MRGQPREAPIEDSFALARLKKSTIYNKDALANKYAMRAKDVRTDAVSYLIRNRHILNDELSFNGSASKRFGEILVPSAGDGLISPLMRNDT